MLDESVLVYPGLRLCPSSSSSSGPSSSSSSQSHTVEYSSGPGTYTTHGYIYASRLGRIKVRRSIGRFGRQIAILLLFQIDAVGEGQSVGGSLVSVLPCGGGKSSSSSLVPRVGDVVTARVTSVNQR